MNKNLIKMIMQMMATGNNPNQLVQQNGHLTVSDFGGVIKDIFGCSHEIVDEFWVVK